MEKSKLMKRLPILFIILFAFTLKACAQQAQTFDEVATFNKGFRFSLDGHIYMSIPTSGVIDWNTILNKPLTFPPALHTHTYAEITGKPQEISLSEAIAKLGYLPIPGNSTSGIKNIFLPKGKYGIIKDTTINAYRFWNGTSWDKIVITSN